MLRQHELLMIQQHTAQVLELQRNAQLVVRGICLAKHTYAYQSLHVVQALVLQLFLKNIYIYIYIYRRPHTET